MVIGEKKTCIAYRCPQCGGGVMGICADLLLSGGRMLKLKCPCGQSHMTAEETQDGKIRLTAPCLLCAKDHRYLVSKSVFYDRELFLLNCAYSNLDICFAGDEQRVSRALEENEKELKKLFSDAGLSTLAGIRREEEAVLPDAQVLDIIRFLVRELEADGQIDCPCHDGEYEIEFTTRGVRVYCLHCNGEHFFDVSSVEAARALLSCDSLTLREPHEQP